MRYLVATDGSEEARKAVRYAARQAVPADATLEIVHVLEPEPELRDGELVLPGGDTATELAERTLERAREVATESVTEQAGDMPVETELLAGRPANAIADYAEQTGADAIYMGHRGLSEQRGQQVGSVAKSILGKVTRPVTVVR